MQDILYAEEMFDIKREVYTNYFELIQSKYKSNPYHNSKHAADVICSALFFIMSSFLKESFDNIENFAVLIASATHDVAHPGLNNRFLVNNREAIATTYNDISVLESMHSALAFTTMQDRKTKANILESFSQ